MVKTAPSHGAISGSNPLGVTSIQEHLIGALFLCVQIGEDRKLKRKQITSKAFVYSMQSCIIRSKRKVMPDYE